MMRERDGFYFVILCSSWGGQRGSREEERGHLLEIHGAVVYRHSLDRLNTVNNCLN